MRTAFTDLLGVEHPIVQAPMGGTAGGALAAAVSNAGAFGMVGGGGASSAWLERELQLVTAGTDRPWGVGFLTWNVTHEALELALAAKPTAVLLSFGDPTPYLDQIRAASAKVILQVGDLDSARAAVASGADVIVAQGVESGGHSYGKARGTMTFTPLVVDLAPTTPVLAAGGIADGRGIAAALALGAQGAMLGTRFQATREALIDERTAQALVEGSGEDTERSSVLDVARGSAWPHEYPGRSLPHPLLDAWRGRDAELTAHAEELQDAYRQGPPVIWAGEGLDLVTDLPGAGDLVQRLAAETRSARGTQ